MAAVHIGASGIGGAVGGFFTGGLAGMAVGGAAGLGLGVLEVAYGGTSPGPAGAFAGLAAGGIEGAMSNEPVGGALRGAAKGAFGEMAGVAAGLAVRANAGPGRYAGYGSMTIGARQMMTFGAGLTLTGLGGLLGAISQMALEDMGQRLCMAQFGQGQ